MTAASRPAAASDVAESVSVAAAGKPPLTWRGLPPKATQRVEGGILILNFGLSDFGLSDFASSVQRSAEFAGEFQTGFEEVGGEHAHPFQLQQAGEHQADRPRPATQHHIAGPQRRRLDGFEHGVTGSSIAPSSKAFARGNFHHTRQHEAARARIPRSRRQRVRSPR